MGNIDIETTWFSTVLSFKCLQFQNSLCFVQKGWPVYAEIYLDALLFLLCLKKLHSVSFRKKNENECRVIYLFILTLYTDRLSRLIIMFTLMMIEISSRDYFL